MKLAIDNLGFPSTLAGKPVALLGDPVAHSLSPRMHESALRGSGLEGSYRAIQVGVVLLAHAARLENRLVIGLDQHVPELADFRVGQDPYRRFDAVERHETQRAAQAESPMMIFPGSTQRFRSQFRAAA